MATGLPIPATQVEDQLPKPSRGTKAIYRLLMMRGLESEEAANLTAFLHGIPIADTRWKLAEVNRLLFLRDLNRRGAFVDGPGTVPIPGV